MGGKRRISSQSSPGTPLTSLWPMIPEEYRRGLFLPPGYGVGSEALVDADGRTVTATPLIPITTIHDLVLRETHLEILILDHGTFRREVVPRQEVFDHRRLIRLANLGLDVTSASAPALVKFLQAFDRHNLLPVRRQTRRLGWHPQESGGFYLVDRAYPEGERVEFIADTEELERFRAACRQRGELSGWLDIFRRVLPYPKVVVCILAALVPPLRELLGLAVRNFWLHLAGRSTTGKNAAQRLAVSVWADPTDEEAWIPHAHATYAGVETLLLRVYGLPAFLQDTHMLRDDDRTRLVMGVGNQAFKARGGERRWVQARWHGALISSGELSIVTDASLQGEAARVITLHGPPFGAQSEELRELIDEVLMPGVQAHHSLVGPKLLETLLAAPSAKRLERRFRFEALRQRFAAKAKGHPLLARQAPHYAALALAGELLAELLSIEAHPVNDAVEVVFAQARERPIPSPARRAYELLLAGIQSRRKSCWVWDGTRYAMPNYRSSEQVGAINESEGFVACYRPFAEEFLRRQRLDPATVLDAMRDDGLLLATDGRYTSQVKIGNKRPRMLKLRWSPEEGELPEIEDASNVGDAP